MKSKEKGICKESDLFFATPGNLAKELFFYVTCTGHFWYEDTYRIWRDNYNSYLVMYILKGRAKVFCEGRAFDAEENQTVFLDCCKPHGYEAKEGLETLWFHFDGHNTEEFYRYLYNLQGCVMNAGDPYTIKNNMYKIYHMHSGKEVIDEALQSAYIARILAEFFPHRICRDKESPTGIEKSINFIHEHFKEGINVKMLASQAALSEYHFLREFKKETGFTPHEYLVKTRMNKAKVLLRGENESIAQVAEECGFSNESTFIKTYKRHTGMTPGKFRKMIM
ncbi:MAG: AraC family transcriptional regulator [Eubacteriales bacterium]|nr:AraC family transcriptional regulator [Eubacteriales bacterium]